MLNGRAADIKKHRWFEGFNWAEMEARRNTAPRKPRESDITKRIKELTETERRTAGKVSTAMEHNILCGGGQNPAPPLYPSPHLSVVSLQTPKETPEELQECEAVFADF